MMFQCFFHIEDQVSIHGWYCPDQLKQNIRGWWYKAKADDKSFVETFHWLTILEERPELLYNSICHFGSYSAGLHWTFYPDRREMKEFVKADVHHNDAFLPDVWNETRITRFLQQAEQQQDVINLSDSSDDDSS